MPLDGVNCRDAGAEKLIPVSVSATVLPCVPCTGVNPRNAGGCGVGCGVPHAAIPGGQLWAAVTVNDVDARKLWSASISVTCRAPAWALASIWSCAEICVGETTRSEERRVGKECR